MYRARLLATAVVPAVIGLTDAVEPAAADQVSLTEAASALARLDIAAPRSCTREVASSAVVLCRPGWRARIRLEASQASYALASTPHAAALRGPPLRAGDRVLVRLRDTGVHAQLAAIAVRRRALLYERFAIGASHLLRGALVTRARSGRPILRLTLNGHRYRPEARSRTVVAPPTPPPEPPRPSPPPPVDPGPSVITECGPVAPADADDAEAFDELWHADRNGPGWTGGDGTVSASLGDGRLAWLFGDTFLGGVQPDGRRAPDWRLIHNALVVQDGACLNTVIGGSLSAPDALLRPAEPGTWWWPMAATKAVGSDSLELVLMRVVRTGTGAWSFAVTGVDRAVLDLRSWAVAAAQPVATDGTILWGAALLPEDGFIYVYGVENRPLDARVYLARTADASLLSDWDYFTGDQQPWSKQASAAVPLMTTDQVPLTGLTSASVVEDADGVALVSQEPGFGTKVRAWRADRPEGPFGPPQTIADVAPPAGVVGAFTYNAHLHPELAADGRQLLSYDVNGGDTMADASLYRPRFVALDWPTSLPDSPASTRRATPRSVALP